MESGKNIEDDVVVDIPRTGHRIHDTGEILMLHGRDEFAFEVILRRDKKITDKDVRSCGGS